MEQIKTADLHIHSKFSDGSDSVEKLIVKIKNVNLSAFSLTDHDEIEGNKIIAPLIPNGIKFITGTELSCIGNGIKSHILGYKIDINNPDLINLIKKGKLLRRQKLEARIKYLNEVHNIKLNQYELNWLYSRKSVVKIHVANVLVERGLAKNNTEAMQKYLNGCKTQGTRFDTIEAISVIKKAKGIAVWAHPLGGEGEKHLFGEEFIKRFNVMKDFGIDGLECYYSRYSKEETDFLIDIARKNNLLISGGSDYHGTNKDGISLANYNLQNLSPEIVD